MSANKDDSLRELLTPKISIAVEVAALVKRLPILEAAELIEQYAKTVTAGERLDDQCQPGRTKQNAQETQDRSR